MLRCIYYLSVSLVWVLLFNILSIVVACEVMHFVYNGFLMKFPFSIETAARLCDMGEYVFEEAARCEADL